MTFNALTKSRSTDRTQPVTVIAHPITPTAFENTTETAATLMATSVPTPATFRTPPRVTAVKRKASEAEVRTSSAAVSTFDTQTENLQEFARQHHSQYNRYPSMDETRAFLQKSDSDNLTDYKIKRMRKAAGFTRKLTTKPGVMPSRSDLLAKIASYREEKKLPPSTKELASALQCSIKVISRALSKYKVDLRHRTKIPNTEEVIQFRITFKNQENRYPNDNELAAHFSCTQEQVAQVSQEAGLSQKQLARLPQKELLTFYHSYEALTGALPTLDQATSFFNCTVGAVITAAYGTICYRDYLKQKKEKNKTKTASKASSGSLKASKTSQQMRKITRKNGKEPSATALIAFRKRFFDTHHKYPEIPESANHFKCSNASITSARRKAGISKARKKRVPPPSYEALQEYMRSFQEKHQRKPFVTESATRFNCGTTTISKVLRESGLAKAKNARPSGEAFKAFWEQYMEKNQGTEPTREVLSKHFGCGISALLKSKKEAGLARIK